MYESLSPRFVFSESLEKDFARLYQGYKGECYVASLLDKENYEKTHLIFDLELNVDGNECQLDILCFHQHELYYFEVKYFEGEYSYNNDRWYLTRQKREINNPIHQLHRSQRLLQQFLQQQQLKIPVKSLLIFANPHFHMYQAQENMPIIFPGQLHHFFQKLSNRTSNWNKYFEKIRHQLIQSHSPILRDKNDPIYEWGQLRKGLFCMAVDCHQQLQRLHRDHLVCPSCETQYQLENSIFKAIKDFNILFPNEVITVRKILAWTGGIVSFDYIYRTLKKMMNLVGNGKGSYYTF